VVAAILGIQVNLDIPQTLSAGKLCYEEGDKLIPATDLAQPLPNMMHFGQPVEFMSWHKLEQLGENSVIMRHDLTGC